MCPMWFYMQGTVNWDSDRKNLTGSFEEKLLPISRLQFFKFCSGFVAASKSAAQNKRQNPICG